MSWPSRDKQSSIGRKVFLEEIFCQKVMQEQHVLRFSRADFSLEIDWDAVRFVVEWTDGFKLNRWLDLARADQKGWVCLTLGIFEKAACQSELALDWSKFNFITHGCIDCWWLCLRRSVAEKQDNSLLEEVRLLHFRVHHDLVAIQRLTFSRVRLHLSIFTGGFGTCGLPIVVEDEFVQVWDHGQQVLLRAHFAILFQN